MGREFILHVLYDRKEWQFCYERLYEKKTKIHASIKSESLPSLCDSRFEDSGTTNEKLQPSLFQTFFDLKSI